MARRSTTHGNLKALEKLKEWADKGYLGKGDTYNSSNETNAAVAFSKGKGALLLAATGRPRPPATGSATTRCSSTCRPARAATCVGIGSTSFPMHISAKTKQPDLAAAYLDWITGPTAGQALVDTQQVPAATDGDRRAGRPARQGGQGRAGTSSSRTAA